MDSIDWQARWSEGRIGFHLGKPHGLLERHLDLFAGAGSVLVPLAGKTADLDCLASVVPQVIANEFVEAAPRAYFAEREVSPHEARRGSTRVLTHGPITYLVDDFFALEPHVAGGYDAFFDRAALIAVLPQDRERYVAALVRLTHPGTVGLLITVEYDPSVMDGPPFSVDQAEVARLFGAHFDVRELDARKDQVGSKPVLERAWRLERSSAA